MSYDAKFYASQSGGSARSASQIIPLVNKFLRPRSLLDIGCGTGSWLRIAAENGIEDIFGVDGPWAQKAGLVVSQDQFKGCDLSTPIDLGRRFDLVMTMEVAEHIPPDRADTFIDTLCRHGEIILFSAALPGQGGRLHFNEQFLSYWANKFAARGYGVADVLRPYLWQDDAIGACYRQNSVLFVKSERVFEVEAAARNVLGNPPVTLDLAHPQLLKERADFVRLGRNRRFRMGIKLLISAVRSSYKYSV